MRHIAAYAFCILLAVPLCAGKVWCAVWEFHPGVYASYLFTDNYTGTAEDRQEEDVYAVGPSLALSCVTQQFEWGLVGHVAWNFHKINEEDDTTEAGVATHARFNGRDQSLELSYDYRETRERATLDQAPGVRRIHDGALSYNRVLTPSLSVSLGYDRNMEYAPPPDDDVVSDGGSLGLSYRVTPKTSLGISASYTSYRYVESLEDSDESSDSDGEVSQDAQIARASLRWNYSISPRLSVGPNLGFERHTYDDPPGESSDSTDQEYYTDLDIYTAALSLEYSLSPSTAVSASVGGSWLKPEDGDREYLTSGRCGLRHDTQDDHFLADFMYGYAYAYDAQNDLGIYETAAVNGSWEHLFTPSILSILGCNYSSRTLAQTDRATETGDAEDRRDIMYRVGLTYRTSIGEGTSGMLGFISQQADRGGDSADSSQSSQEQTGPTEPISMPWGHESKAGLPITTHWPRGMLEVRALYERLAHKYEHSDSVTENRYSITIEVRY